MLDIYKVENFWKLTGKVLLYKVVITRWSISNYTNLYVEVDTNILHVQFIPISDFDPARYTFSLKVLQVK